MALVSLLPYIDSRSSDPWSPLHPGLDMSHYVEQISAVFENPSIQHIPGGDSKAIWDTRTTYDFPNNVIDEMELYPRKKRKTPRSVKSMDPDSPTCAADKTFEMLHKAVWTAAPSGLRRRKQDPWTRPRPSLEKQQAEDLRQVGQLSMELSDVPSLTDSSSLPSLPTLTVSTPTSTNLDNLEPHVLASGYQDLETIDPVERLDSWMETLQTSVGSPIELDPPPIVSQRPMAAPEPELGPPRRSNTLPVERTLKKPKIVRQIRKRGSWPDGIVALKRPAFPRKKLQELQTTTTREEFRKSLTVAEVEKRAKSKRMLSLLLPLVKPKEALQFFPLFTKREVKLLTEILEEDKKLAMRLASVGVTLPLNRDEILELAASKKDADEESIGSTSTDDGASSRLSTEVVSIASSRMDISTSSNGVDGPYRNFPADQDVDKEIHRHREKPSHLLPSSTATDRNWTKLVKELDPRFRYITWCKGVWTLELESFNPMDIPLIPLYIAGAPVILSYARPTPQISGQRPPDPLRDHPLPVGTLPNLSDEILSILFKTFPRATMACVFINQRMSIVYDHDFDHGIEHMTKPETFGGYRVSFMRNKQAFTATSNPLQSDRLLTGKRVEVCRPGHEHGWTSCLGVRLRRKKPSTDPKEPNDAITMTTHAFLTALRLPSPESPTDEESIDYPSRASNSSRSSEVSNEDFASMKVIDRTKKGAFGQYYHTYDNLKKLRGNIEASKFLHDLCLIKSIADPPQELPVISFQRKKKNEFKRMEWCTSPEMLRARKGKMYLLNSWLGADSKNPKDGNIVAEGLVIGEAYQNISRNQKGMYSRSILWRQNFTSKQWQVGQVRGLKERAYRVWNGAPVRRLRLEQHLVIQEHGYSGSPLAVKVSDKPGKESYAIFGFQNYAMRCWRGDDDDGFKKAAFGSNGGGGSVVNQVLMEALDHGAYEFFGSYKLPKKVTEDWDIVYDVEEKSPGEVIDVKGKMSEASSVSSEVRAVESDDGEHVRRSSRRITIETIKRQGRRLPSPASSSCVIA
ncbi:hypothetical protein TWF192_001807 [Orbilia oligospora]|uniref:Uncharacterized protein n=1 Tax=Orbilia oligospora TaxID=2813651 RepID=A0A6G1MHF6_ORBOL|nr:hypothetical protein TWF191_000655 [Orbilia oligospora]KAF3208465.1 hypothetical protein TWF191_000655 [Orbilia oligospora]KAF3256382.1 hypothetical protein TWF192_001807 [Orbilia oligospora]